jgi:hypothetical protein
MTETKYVEHDKVYAEYNKYINHEVTSNKYGNVESSFPYQCYLYRP